MAKFIRFGLLILCIFALEFTVLFSPLENMSAYLTGLIYPSLHPGQSGQNSDMSKRVEDAQVRALKNENASLKDALKFSERTQQSPLLSRRIGRSTDPFQSHIVLDKGTRDGVTVGDPVLGGDGLLVGTITTSEQNKSFVLPLTDSRSKILASIVQEKIEIRGIAEGQFATGVSMTLIPISAELKNDDLVITSGLQDRIPAGLVIGTIHTIQKNPEDLFQSAILNNVVSINEFPLLSILISSEK